jgi:hypothetical protein
LSSSTNIITVSNSRKLRQVGHISHMEMRNAYKILVRKPEGKRPFRKSRYRWKNNIMVDFKETGREGVDWILMAQDRVQWWAFVNMVMNLCVPYRVGNFFTS